MPPSSSGTPRPASKYRNVAGPGKFKAGGKRVTVSSGTVRSTPIPAAHRRARRQGLGGPWGSYAAGQKVR